MARIARVVVPEFPHHIIQRGNRRQKVFFREGDYSEYLRLLNYYSQRFKVDILAYCLMPTHVHLIAVPRRDGNLARAIGETHRNYTRFINLREKWRGYLWQGRFLYRFSKSKYVDKFVLKGALLFAVWQIPDRRTTLDIDFLARFDNEVQ